MPSPPSPLRIPAVGVLLLAALVLAGCGSGSAPLLPGASTAPVGAALVAVESTGGECRSGLCSSVVTITTSGQVSRDGGPAVAVPQPMLAALVEAIRATDVAIVLARPFTGECPVNYDGQKQIYAIATPNDGSVVIDSCEVEVDPAAPLFAAIERIAALAPYPTE